MSGSSVAKLAVLAWLAFNILWHLTRIGKPQKTLTMGDVAFGVLEYVAVVAVIVLWWH
jgi:hypothetical protein